MPNHNWIILMKLKPFLLFCLLISPCVDGFIGTTAEIANNSEFVQIQGVTYCYICFHINTYLRKQKELLNHEISQLENLFNNNPSNQSLSTIRRHVAERDTLKELEKAWH